MQKICFVLVGFAFFFSACGVSKNATKKSNSSILTYNITPVLKGNDPHIDITFQAKSDANGHIQLGYPNNDWGETDLYKSLKNFTSSPASKHEFQKKRNQVYVWGEPNTTYTFSYTIAQDFKALPRNDNAYRAIVNKEYFHVLGKNLFLLPYGYFGDEEVSCDVKLTWKFPRNKLKIVNSFGAGKEQLFKASYHELYSSIFIGGDITPFQSEIKGNKVVFATTDQWEHIDIEKAARDLTQIIEQHRDFWNDHTSKLSTVTLIKTFEECPDQKSCSNSISGTALTNSFASFCSDNWLSSNDRMNWLFSHELFHNWVGHTIKNESEEKQYWFSEGFTDYYAYKLMIKSGMMSINTFIEKVNEEIIEPHYTASNRNSPNDELDAERFWSIRMWEKLPYRRGWLYAFYLDSKLKNENQGKSLDDVMRQILKTTQTENSLFNRDVFVRAIEPFTENDFESDYYQYIELGNPIDLSLIKVPGLYFDEGEVPYMRMSQNISDAEITNFLKK